MSGSNGKKKFERGGKPSRKTRSRFSAGFTLVELMVALALFTIVVLAAVSSLYTVNNAARKVEAMRSVLDNLNFAVESMSRTIRTGTNIVCGGIVNSGGQQTCTFGPGMANFNAPGERISLSGTLGTNADLEYRLWFVNGNGEIQKRTKQGGVWSDTWVSLTAPEINVQKLSFYVDGTAAGDQIQPSVIMLIQGVAKTQNDTAPFAIQTYVSARAAE